MIEINRCGWCNNDELYQAYHDSEWGVPCRDDKKLFEFLILEGAQGRTILDHHPETTGAIPSSILWISSGSRS
jgi:hypothetical protein